MIERCAGGVIEPTTDGGNKSGRQRGSMWKICERKPNIKKKTCDRNWVMAFMWMLL